MGLQNGHAFSIMTMMMMMIDLDSTLRFLASQAQSNASKMNYAFWISDDFESHPKKKGLGNRCDAKL